MSPENSLNFLAYSGSDFLDKACHYFVTTNPDFAQIQPDSRSFLGPRSISEKYYRAVTSSMHDAN
jgi:hypothetical protein